MCDSKVTLQFDGASRGNPGLGASGFVFLLKKANTVIAQGGRTLPGRVTCNVAEYQGLIDGLRYARAHSMSGFLVEGDSRLITSQARGSWKVKDTKLQPLCVEAQALLFACKVASITWIPRAQNALADRQCNLALSK